MNKTNKIIAYLVYGLGIWICFWIVCITVLNLYLVSKSNIFSVFQFISFIISYLFAIIIYWLIFVYFVRDRVIEVSCTNANTILKTATKKYAIERKDIIEKSYRHIDNSFVITFYFGKKIKKLRIPKDKGTILLSWF